MAQKFLVIAFAIIIIMILTMVSCGGGQRVLYYTPEARVPLGTPELIPPAQDPAEDAAVAAIMLTQEQAQVDAEAEATAQMARAMAQAVLNSANATLGVAQTQAQGEANQLAAELAATAEILRADAQSTLVSAAFTQVAAQTQDSIRQTQDAAFATSDALVLLDQQNEAALAAGTQTAVANIIATRTQAAVATLQGYADDKRELEDKLQGPFTYFWMCGLPIFLALLAGLGLWAFWRWTKIKQDNQRMLESPVQVFQSPAPIYFDDTLVDHHPHLTAPGEQVNDWMDEVKTELLNNDEKDQDDNATR